MTTARKLLSAKLAPDALIPTSAEITTAIFNGPTSPPVAPNDRTRSGKFRKLR
jgi:hypothetical protein